MGMPAVSQPPYWTASMVRELPDDGKRYECIDGELLVTPSPGTLHQWIVGRLHWIVDADARLVERWTPTDARPEIIGEDTTLEWSPPGANAPFTLVLGPFFAEIETESQRQ